MAGLEALWKRVKAAEKRYDDSWDYSSVKGGRSKDSPKAKELRRKWEHLYTEYKNKGGTRRI